MRSRVITALILAMVFGNLALHAQQDGTAAIAIDASRVEAEISPRMYGHFTEFMFQDIKGGLHAELLRDRGFEDPANVIGLSRYWEREPDDRNDDYAMRFHWDDSVFYPVSLPLDHEAKGHSLRIDIRENDGQRRGINQGGIPIRSGVAYVGYLWLKTAGFDGHVNVALEQDRSAGERYAVADIAHVQGDWTKYEFRLTPSKSDPLAKIAILFYGKGRIWIDQPSLMPSDAVDSVRPDVYSRIKDLRPAFVRWPGGNVAQDYHWMWGIGPRDRRTTWSNLSWWNEAEPSDFGTDEFIRFCRRLPAGSGTCQPHLVVNIEGRGATTEEAAAWVQYVNGSASSKFGAMRSANGHAEPYAVKTWELGNEIWGDWVRGHSDAATYARNCKRYHDAMVAVDPAIEFIAVGDNNLDWDRTVLRGCGRDINLLAIHHYYGAAEMAGDPLNLMAHPLAYERFYKQLQQIEKETIPGKTVKLIINEWNTSLPMPRQHSMESALYAARLMNVFERSTEMVEMNAVSDLVNGWPGGIIQASRHDVFVTPTYLAIKLYNDHLGGHRLATTVTSPTFDTTREGKAVPYLDVTSSRSRDGRHIYIKAVNTDRQHALATSVTVAGAQISTSGTLSVLNAARFEDANSFTTPDAVKVSESSIPVSQKFQVTLPEHSVSVITLDITGP